MAAPYSTILNKVDRAFVAYLGTKSIGTANIYTGKQSVDKPAPCVISYSESATEEPYQSGNWKVKTAIMVKTMAPTDADGVDPSIESNAIVGNTFDAIMQGIVGDSGNFTALADLLNAQGIADLTIMAVSRVSVEQNFDGDAWVDTINLEIFCAPISGL